jgi:hypothetical protein
MEPSEDRVCPRDFSAPWISALHGRHYRNSPDSLRFGTARTALPTVEGVGLRRSVFRLRWRDGITGSHRGGPSPWTPPMVLATLTLASWALRPRSRRLGQTVPIVRPPILAWSALVTVRERG